jgi:phosphinothricin acetyltransferase
MTGITIRMAEDSDRDEIIEIFNYYIKEGFAAYPDSPVPPGSHDILLGGIHACFIIENNCRVAGFSTLRPLLPFSTFAKSATISTFIENNSRYNGYGKMLLNRVELEARSRNITLLLASISSENKESLKFHAKLGFVECGRFYKAGIKFNTPFDLVWMEKMI